MQTDYLSLEGPVERQNDQLVLRIPMHAGGARLHAVAQTISFVEDGNLVVFLPVWLAERMQLDEGSAVHVDDRWGKLNIARVH